MTADYIHPQLRPLAVRVDSLALDPKNARRHPDRNMRAICESLKRFGQRKAIVVQRTADGKHVVRAGNGTLHATQILKREYIAAVIVDENDADATAYAIADNRSAELADWDEFRLADALGEIQDAQYNLDAFGFSEKEYDKLLKSIGKTDDELNDGDPLIKQNVEYLLVVSLADEQAQSELYEELLSRGMNCKIM